MIYMKNLKKLLKVVRLLGKMKLYELAKEMDISSKDLLEKAKALGINIKSHLSNIEDEDAKKLRENFGKKTKESEIKAVKKEEKKHRKESELKKR